LGKYLVLRILTSHLYIPCSKECKSLELVESALIEQQSRLVQVSVNLIEPIHFNA
jgi:hypothetical protein